MRKVTVAAVQMACAADPEQNRRTAAEMVRRAAADGAQIILLPELFEPWLPSEPLPFEPLPFEPLPPF